MQCVACSGILQTQCSSNSLSSSFWNDGTIPKVESQRAPVQRIWHLTQAVAHGARGRGSRGRGNSNWGSRTLSKDFRGESFGREDYSSRSAGQGQERGRGSGGSYRGNGGSRGSYRGSGGSRGSYRGNRGSGGSYRGNRGARGSGNGTTRGRGNGSTRYAELRRLAEKRMHDGAFEILDEETGEKVIVWGVEDAESWPKPTAEDLNWKPTTMAVAGDVSEEGWYKAMEASMAGPSGAFSVKGVRQGGVYAEEEDEDEEDEMEDTDDDEDEDEDEFDDVLPEEPPRVVKSVRTARLRVFGRDFKQKEVLKLEASEEVHYESSSDGALAQKLKPELSVNDVSSFIVDVDSPSSIDVEQSWPPAGHLLTGSSSDVAPLLGAESNTEKIPYSDQNSLSNEEDMEQQWPPVGAMFSGDSGASSSDGHLSVGTVSFDASLEARSGRLSLSTNEKSREIAWKDEERVVREEDWKRGGMNPGIIDIDEDDDEDGFKGRRMGDRKPHDPAPLRSNLLDDLRLQTHRRLGSKAVVEDGDKLVAKSQGDHSTEEDSSNVTVLKPRGFRDLKARTNYDPSLAAEFFSTKSFKDVGASEEIIVALKTLQLRRPSAIQAMSFKPILEGQSCIVADQTGSGKTLAYLAPLVQMLRAEEGKSQTKQLNKKPPVLVLVPTSELAVQVLNVCRAFSRGGAPFRSIVLTGGFKWKTQVESLQQGADVVVATPGRFLQHLEKGSLKLDNLKTVVLDEVDILYDDQEFAEVLQTLEQAASKRVQYVHVTATLPVDIHDSLLTRYPDAIPLMGPTLHRTAVGLQEVLVDCSGAEGEEKTPEKAFLSKKEVLLQLVDQRPVSKTIIFCNKIETCRNVENALQRHDRSGSKLTVLPYHAALSQEARQESMQQFLESQPSKSLFLVCTDRASRGLDSFDVEHVVLFDYPRDPSEYVRRVGRTARGAGGTGKVFVFALGKQVAMARRIMARNEKGRPIHDIPGSAYET